MYNRFTKCWLIILLCSVSLGAYCQNNNKNESLVESVTRVSVAYKIPSGILWEILDDGCYDLKDKRNNIVDEMAAYIRIAYGEADLYFELHPTNRISSGDLVILKWIMALNIFNDSPRIQYPDSYRMPLVQRYAITYPQGLRIMYMYHQHYLRYMLSDGIELLSLSRNPIMGTLCSPECAQLFTDDFTCYMQLR